MICLGRHVGGHILAHQHGGQNYFLPTSFLTFDSYAQMCCKRYHIILFNIHVLILRKWCGFEKPNHYYFI